MEPITKKRAAKWVIATTFTPLAVSLLAANGYIAVWFTRMAMAGTPHAGPPPLSVVQRGVLLTAGVGLWFTDESSPFGEATCGRRWRRTRCWTSALSLA